MTDLVLITGGSSGLGLALARSVPFAATVVDISRSGAGDDSVTHLAADLANPTEWVRVGNRVAELVDEHSPERCVLIHAAGVLTPIGFAGEVESADYTANVLLNSASGQVLGHLFLKALGDRHGRFDLVMISSGAARSVYAGWSSYGAAKAALDQWVRIVGSEQRLRGRVRVSSIAPGVVATAMQDEIRRTSPTDFPDVARFRSLHDDEELAEPEHAARAIWAVIEGGVETGSVVDVRDLA